jgi:hypothetical protein
VNDLCAGMAPPMAVRGRTLGWLAQGAAEINWALCSIPRERWTIEPPEQLLARPALRHVRQLLLREQLLTLPAVRRALGETDAAPASTVDFEQAEAAWDPKIATEAAEELVRDLGGVRFELLQRAESAPEEAWSGVELDSKEGQVGRPPRLDELLLMARQHELEHLAAMWRMALFWDRIPPPSVREAQDGSAGYPLHPADRFSQGVTLR